MPVHRKSLEWLKRYLPAEIISYSLTFISSVITYTITNSFFWSSIIATVVDYISYYGYFIVNNNKKIPLAKKIKEVAIEFGPGEILDWIIRPFSLYFFQVRLGNKTGTIVGKIIADLLFYIPTIIMYEKKVKKRN